MARIIVHADSLERLKGFLVGVDWINDGAVRLVSVDVAARAALLEDGDADTDGRARLGPDGLTWVEDDPSPKSSALP